jgi:hypothetical protein
MFVGKMSPWGIVQETFSSRTADAVDRARYEVLTALQWLQRFNAGLREQGR